jgi:glycerol-3-phosphate dehydrogenase
LQDGAYDLAVIGGGINGCGIARDAKGRGLSVVLVEQGDLAGATSSASTKLIHGGLRYLEHFEFRLVREALAEREVLLSIAPHIIWPVRFVLPHHRGLRPWPVIRLGLFLYDHLGGRRVLPPTSTLDLGSDPAGKPLKPEFRRAFEYSDCSVQDSRLVILNARDAADKGAVVLTQTRCTKARVQGQQWVLSLENQDNGERSQARARALVNASGPWVSDVLHDIIGRDVPLRIRMVKGSHIIVDRLFDHDKSYIFQNVDNRICFAIPYEHDFTLIGTTDEDYTGDPSQAAITEAEIDYLLGAVNEYFRTPVTRSRIRGTYSGVRPLYDDGTGKPQEATRDYELKLGEGRDGPPVLSIFGGKITTYRKLSEQAVEKFRWLFPQMGGPWTNSAPLPGGDFDFEQVAGQISTILRRIPDMKAGQAERMFRCYGTRTMRIINGASKMTDLGEEFGGGLTRREVDYLISEEWARSAEDILWRRTKLGLYFDSQQTSTLQSYVQALTTDRSPARQSIRHGSAS